MLKARPLFLLILVTLSFVLFQRNLCMAAAVVVHSLPELPARPANLAPTAPPLFAPLNAMKQVTRTPTLQWEAAIDPDYDVITYDVYVDTAPNPQQLVASGIQGLKYKATVAEPYTTYYWKVVARDGKGGATASVVRSFTPWVAPAADPAINMVNVQGGTFAMGEDRDAIFVDEDTYTILPYRKPKHQVTLGDFSIGKYEVTYAQFFKFLLATRDAWFIDQATARIIFEDKNFPTIMFGVPVYNTEYPLCKVWIDDGSAFDYMTDSPLTWDGINLTLKAGMENYPVTWLYFLGKGAVLFADWAGKRLPTEAEWEYAARGGRQSQNYNFSGSNDFRAAGFFMKNAHNANNPMSGYNNGNTANNGMGTHSGGEKIANELALYDMAGNVREICNDWYAEAYYSVSEPTNPQGPFTGTYLCARGGHWYLPAHSMMSTDRSDVSFSLPDGYTLGFRVAGEHTSNTTAFISGYIIDENNKPLAGAEVEVGPYKTVTTASGRYMVEVPKNFTGTITPVLRHYNFSPASVTVTSVREDLVQQNFSALLNRDHLVSGTVKNAAGTAMQNITIKGFPTPVKTNMLGNYSTYLPTGYSCTITPEATGYTFTPQPIAITNIHESKTTLNFTGTFVDGRTISGHVANEYGVVSTGDLIKGLPGTVKTNNGVFYTSVTMGWSGTITPEREGYQFTPPSFTVTNHQVSTYNFDFVKTFVGTCKVWGYVTDGMNNPVDDVTLQGFPTVVKTNVSGYYFCEVTKGWSGTITPVKDRYIFIPASTPVTSTQGAELAYVNFRGEAVPHYTLEGTIADTQGNPLHGVNINGLGRALTTDATGRFTTTVAAGWSGTLIPERATYSFSPAQLTLTGVQANNTANDFTATASSTASLFGRVADRHGNGLPGVSVNTGAGTIQTDANGYYALAVPLGFTGTLTPAHASYTLSPATLAINNVQAAWYDLNFTATAPTYTISGTITDNQQQALAGVEVTTTLGATHTNAQGYYALGVPAGWSGSVNVALPLFTFIPAQATFTDVQANVVNQNFTGTYNGTSSPNPPDPTPITAIDNEAPGAAIYPNPSEGRVTITTPQACSHCTVSVYTTTGTLLLQQPLSDTPSTEVNIPRKGVFILTISDGKQITIEKVVVK